MPEPHTTGAGLSILSYKFGAILGAGALGALMIAAVDPPKTRGEQLLRALAAASSLLFAPSAIRLVDSYLDYFPAQGADLYTYLELALPVAFLVGAMSWACVGVLVQLQRILRERAAARIADVLSLDNDKLGPGK